MADTKISELPVATAIASPDVSPIVQGGVTKQVDVSLFGSPPPFTLTPGDVLAQDASDNPILSYETVDTRDCLMLPSQVAMASPGTDIAVPIDCDFFIKFVGGSLDGGLSINPGGTGQPGIIDITTSGGDPDGAALTIATGQSNSGTDGNGGDILITPGSGTGSGRNGIVDINGTLLVENLFQLSPLAGAPSPAVEGMIYADTDHHLYYYNGTTWKQLDNVL